VDSRCLLGSLLEVSGERSRVSAISYGADDDDDRVVARDLCETAGVSYRLSGAREDLCDLIRLNGDMHDGQVFFYFQGLAGIAQLADQFGARDTLFVADECFGWRAMQLDSFDDALAKGIGIRVPASVPAYYSHGAYPHEMIEERLQADIEVLRNRCTGFRNWHDCKDFLYLDQRLAHMLLPWRERYAGRYARLANPFLDNDILDFVGRVPTDYRLGKRLFREVAQEMFPELFAMRLAREGGVSTSPLARHFDREKDELANLIDGFESALDAVLPPHVLRSGLENLLQDIAAQRGPAPSTLGRGAAAIHRKWRALRRNVLERRSGPHARRRSLGEMSLSPAQFATVLQLRWYLRKREQVPT
jgi:hypothetical protein